MLDFCFADSMILYFWYVLESIRKLIIELRALHSLSLRRWNKKQRRCRIFSEGRDFFFSYDNQVPLRGNLTTWLPLLDPPRKTFLSPSVWSRSIVCIGVSIPHQKPPSPTSWQAPLKSTNCPAPPPYPPLFTFLRNPSSLLVFCEIPPLKVRFFNEFPNIKVFHR